MISRTDAVSLNSSDDSRLYEVMPAIASALATMVRIACSSKRAGKNVAKKIAPVVTRSENDATSLSRIPRSLRTFLISRLQASGALS